MNREKVITYEYTAYPDAKEVLEYLWKKGCENYTISNNFLELGMVFERLGLGDFIEGYILSAAVGYEKPRQEIYEYAIQKAGNPQVKYMKGDSPITDYEGGLEAGMMPVLVHNQVDGLVCCATLKEVARFIENYDMKSQIKRMYEG